MSAVATVATWLFLQQVPPQALVFGMTIAYALCFAGLIFAYLNYRRRHRGKGDQEK